jgi:hypothetical protein
VATPFDDLIPDIAACCGCVGCASCNPGLTCKVTITADTGSTCTSLYGTSLALALPVTFTLDAVDGIAGSYEGDFSINFGGDSPNHYYHILIQCTDVPLAWTVRITGGGLIAPDGADGGQSADYVTNFLTCSPFVCILWWNGRYPGGDGPTDDFDECFFITLSVP